MKRKRPRELEDSSDEEDEDPGSLTESHSGVTSACSQQDQEASS